MILLLQLAKNRKLRGTLGSRRPRSKDQSGFAAHVYELDEFARVYIASALSRVSFRCVRAANLDEGLVEKSTVWPDLNKNTCYKSPENCREDWRSIAVDSFFEVRFHRSI